MALSGHAQRFAFLSDIHITPGNRSESYLKEAVREINGAGLDFAVLAGDLTNEGSDEELRNVKAILDSVAIPLYVLPGNHETTWSQSAVKTFTDLWGDDRFVCEYDSLVIIGIGCGPYMKMGDGHVKTEDLAWIKSELDRRLTPGKKVLSVNHYPLKDDLDNCDVYTALLSDYPVVAHLGGHYHRWIEYEACDTAGAIPGLMLRALDMGKGNYGYALVDVAADSIRIYDKRIGEEPSRVWAIPNRTGYRKVAERPGWNMKDMPDNFEVELVWADTASVFSSVAFDDRNIYFGNSLGHLKAVTRTAPHAEVWSVPSAGSYYSRPMVMAAGEIAYPTLTGITIVNKDGAVARELASATPYVADGIMTAQGWAQGGYKRMEMRDPSDGRVIWVYDSIFNYCQGAPAVDGSDLVFGAWDTNLRCVDANTGRLRWVWNNGKSANQLGPGNVVPVITPARIYIVAPDRYMTAIDRETGATVWRDNSHRYRESIGRSADCRMVYAKTMDGELVAVATDTPEFKELWTLDLGLGYEHAPCIILEHDGVIYVGSRRGIVTAVNAADRQIAWQLELGKGEVNGFELDAATGDVFLSLVDGKIYRIRQKK